MAVAAYTVGERETVVRPHDTARPHEARIKQENIFELGCHVLPYPPCLPDTVPIDYYLFLIAAKRFDGGNFLK